MLRRVQPALGLASPQGSFRNWRTLALPSPRSSVQRPRWLRTWLPSPCPPWPRAPPDAHPNSWASVPGGGRHPAVTRGTLTPNNPAGTLGRGWSRRALGPGGGCPVPQTSPTAPGPRSVPQLHSSPGPAAGCLAGGAAPGRAGPAAEPADPAAAPRAPAPAPHTPCRRRPGLWEEGRESQCPRAWRKHPHAPRPWV